MTAADADAAFAQGRYALAYDLMAEAIVACRPTPQQPDRCLALLQKGTNIAVAADRATDAERLARGAMAVATRLPDGKPDQVLALASLGGALISQGRVQEAEATFRKALPIARSIEGDHPLTAVIENSLSLNLDAQGKYSEAEPLHRSSLTRLSKLPGADAMLPTITMGLADNLAGQGRLGDADVQYRQALVLARKTNGERHPVVAQILSSQASNAQKRGRFAEAEGLLRQASAIDADALGADHALVGRDKSNMAALYADWGRLPEAEALFRQALSISEKGGADHPAVASDLGNLGGTLRLEGRSLGAEAIIRRALAIDSAAFGADSPRASAHYGNIAASLEDQGRFEAAEPLRRRALTITQQTGGARNSDTASSAVNLAGNLRNQGKFAEAEALLLQAATTQRATFGDRHPTIAIGYSQLGILLAQSGRDKEAKAYFRRALDIRLAILGDASLDTASSYHNWAAILDRLGDARAAEAPARKALAIREALLAPSHPDVASSKQLLARILAHDPSRRPEALTLLRGAMTIARGRRASAFSGAAAGTDIGTIAAAETRARAIDIAVSDPLARAFAAFARVAASRAADVPTEADALRDEAFVAVQDLEVSTAGLTMAQTAVRTAAGQGPLAMLVRRQQDLANRSRLLDQRLIEALGAGQAEKASALRSEIDAVGRDLAATDSQLRLSYPDYAALIAPTSLSVSAVQARLGPEEGLLLIRPIGDDMAVFAVSKTRISWHNIAGGNASTVADVANLRCQVDTANCSGQSAPTGDTPFDPTAARHLYATVVAPVEDTIRGVKTLFVTVSGPLADLPLDMLVTDMGSEWLGDRYAMISLPAVSVLHLRREAQRHGRGAAFVGYGDPTFAIRAADNFFAVSPSVQSETALFSKFDPLPGTRVELNAMAKALGAARGAIVLGPEATEGAVRGDPRLKSAHVVAFATHGFLPRDLNGHNEPGLVFTPPQKASPTDDGFLFASEASTLTIGAEWLVLSACNTASAQGGNDSLSALARAFLYAGATAVLASHWRISDDATAALTVEVLATARKHPAMGRAEARQIAMRAVRSGRRDDGSAVAGWTADWAHPAAWAPFSLIASDER